MTLFATFDLLDYLLVTALFIVPSVLLGIGIACWICKRESINEPDSAVYGEYRPNRLKDKL
jgi:hypothetical protein